MLLGTLTASILDNALSGRGVTEQVNIYNATSFFN